MRRKLWLGTMLVAVAAGVIVTHSATLGMKAVWPFIAGLALTPLGARGRGLIRTAVSVLAGIGAGVAVFVGVTEWMPWIPVSFGIAVGIAIGLMGTAAVFAPRVFALPPMLVAFAVFYGSYATQWAADRGAFRGEAAGAAATVLLSLLAGLAVSFVASQALALEARQRAGEVIPFRARIGGFADEGRRAAAGGM